MGQYDVFCGDGLHAVHSQMSEMIFASFEFNDAYNVKYITLCVCIYI